MPRLGFGFVLPQLLRVSVCLSLEFGSPSLYPYLHPFPILSGGRAIPPCPTLQQEKHLLPFKTLWLVLVVPRFSARPVQPGPASRLQREGDDPGPPPSRPRSAATPYRVGQSLEFRTGHRGNDQATRTKTRTIVGLGRSRGAPRSLTPLPHARLVASVSRPAGPT